MIIDRYLIAEICKPLILVGSVLVAVFGSYTATELLADAAQGLLLGDAVFALVAFKLIVGLEFLLPISLYLSIVMALGRMYADAEITALHACGVSVGRVLKAVLVVSLVLAVLAGCLSLYVRPWAYERFYDLRERAKREFDLARIEEGGFLEIKRERSVIFAEEIDRGQNRAARVFIHKERQDKQQVILAGEAYQRKSGKAGALILEFRDGHLYEFSRQGKGDSVSTFESSMWFLPTQEIPAAGYKRRAAATVSLARSDEPKDLAEFQWRLSVPLTTVLLALLAVPLSRTAPRQGKYAKVVAAVIVYVLYYNLCAVAKSWIEQGIMGGLPGIWWVQACLAAVVFILLRKQKAVLRWRSI